MRCPYTQLTILSTLSTFALLACSGEGDCTRTATCPSERDAGFVDRGGGSSSGSSVLMVRDAGSDADDHADKMASARAPQPEPVSRTPDGGSDHADADESAPGAEPRDTTAADAGAFDQPEDDSSSHAVESPPEPGTDRGTNSEETPTVVIAVPDRDAGTVPPDDAGDPKGCALGRTRPCEGALGACAEGVQTCGEDGEFGPCGVQPNVVDSCSIDGDDSNCDGVPNDGCECIMGQQRVCGPETELGICRQGTSQCEDGGWGPCRGAVFPAPRRCGAPEDNDCDGEPDDTLDGVCQCAAESVRACDEHPGLDGVGSCVAGVSECVVAEDGSRAAWSECTGSVGPGAADSCAVLGDDANCNGIPNQGCDFAPPLVVSSLPANGDTGVEQDAAIVVVFDEPMDRVSTEAALSVSSGAALQVEWNDASTVLTATPTAPFEYARGDFERLQTIPPKKYSFTVGTEATDRAGNALLTPLEVEFETLRRVDHTLLLAQPDGAYIIRRFSATSASPWPCQEGLAWVGHQPTYTIAVVDFDLSPLPSDIVAFEQATMMADQAAVTGDPFDFSGPIDVEHIWVSTAPDAGDAIDADALGELGTLSNSVGLGPVSLDVSAALDEDYQLRIQRNQQSQYRVLTSLVEPAPATAQYVSFTCSEFRLDTTYLVP